MKISNFKNSQNFAINANNKVMRDLQKVSRHIASGQRIGSAIDDASGYAISERLQAKINALEKASVNTKEGSSMLRIADAAVNQQIEIMKTIKSKVIRAANDTCSDADRMEIQKELNVCYSEINEIAHSANYNGKKLLIGDIVAGEVTEAVIHTNSYIFTLPDSVDNCESIGFTVTDKAGDEHIYVLNKDAQLDDETLTKVDISACATMEDVVGAIQAQLNRDDAGFDVALSGSKVTFKANTVGDKQKISTCLPVNPKWDARDKGYWGEESGRHFLYPLSIRYNPSVYSSYEYFKDNLLNTGLTISHVSTDDTRHLDYALYFIEGSDGASVDDVNKKITIGVDYILNIEPRKSEFDINIGGDLISGCIESYVREYSDFISPKITVGLDQSTCTDGSTIHMSGGISGNHNKITPAAIESGDIVIKRKVFANNTVIHTGDRASMRNNVIIGQTTLDHIFGYDPKTVDPTSYYTVMTKDMRDKLLGGLVDPATGEKTVGILAKGLQYLLDISTTIGSQMNRLEHELENNMNKIENLTGASATIRDADMAKEYTEYANKMILAQAAQGTLNIYNHNVQEILALLQ